jgi:hypothetical protein
MHQTNMFQQPNQAPAIQPYDLQQLAPQFADWNFQIGQPYDQYTPQIAVMTVREIQTWAMKGHPIRVAFFNFMAENHFNNASFQDLVYTIIMRVGYGITNQEWRSYDQAVQTVVTRAVKACASSLAAGDQEFIAQFPAQEQAAIRENAGLWDYLMALAQGQVGFIPFAQMGNNGLSNVNTSTQSAIADARNLRGSTAGAFVESGYDTVVPTLHNNNGGQGGGRYAQRSEKIYGKLEGSMQNALGGAGLTENLATGNGDGGVYQSRMKRPGVQGGKTGVTSVPNQAKFATTAADAAKFDSDVTDFSKSLDSNVVTAAPTPAPTPAPTSKPLFVVQIGTETVEIVREAKEGFKVWKSSRLQRFHPAWCTRTHRVIYFETRGGQVLAVLQELTQAQKEIAMNYDAHAIDPTKGQPEPTVPVKPVRPEAAVLYTKAADLKVNIIVSDVFQMEEDVTGAIRSARLAAEMSEKVPDALVKKSVVNAPMIYTTAEDAAEDLTVIKAIANAKDFAEAASYLPNVRNEMARRTIDRTLVKAINRAIECRMGIGIRIGSFEEDGPAICDFLEKKEGSLIGEKLRAEQVAILQTNVRVLPATDEGIRGYADATLSRENEETLSDDMAKRVLFLQHNVCAVWVNFTDNEMAIGVPPKGATNIEPDSLGAVFNIAKAVYNDAAGNMCSEEYLVTKDSVAYSLHRGLINKDCYLLSQKAN